MGTREILPLSILILKAIAKKPGQYLTEASLLRLQKYPKLTDYDITQELIKSITDAGRLTDDVFPIELIDPSRTVLVANNTKLSGKYFRSVFDRCLHLVTIDISGSFQVDDDTMKHLFQRCTKLKCLRIRNCRKLTTSTLQHILSSSIELQELDIGGNINIEIKGIDDFINRFTHIERLENFQLSGLIIRDSTISSIIKRCKGLISIGIAYADVSDQSLARLIQTFGPKLEYLNISWLSTTSSPSHNQIESARLIPVITNHLPVLEELDISGIKSISSTDIIYFLEAIHQRSVGEGLPRHPLKFIHAKFVASNKQLMEQVLLSTFPNVKFDL